MTAQALTIVFQQSGDWWAAWVKELPGANSQGRTLEEARENVTEAVTLILEEGERPEASDALVPADAVLESMMIRL
jgi:predicted RNase H-like HicB family nuclease